MYVLVKKDKGAKSINNWILYWKKKNVSSSCFYRYAIASTQREEGF